MEEKLTTLFVNETEHDLIMKVGNRSSFVPVAEVKRGRQHALRLCMNWTYQEFSLEAFSNCKLGDVEGKKLFVNSDDCCDYERITIKESEAGQFVVDRVARKQAKPEVQSYKWSFPWRFWLWL